MKIYKNIIKYMLDIFFAIIILILSSPFLLLAMLLTKLTTKGPIFFKQLRPGKHGQIFTIYKLRTMTMDTDLNGQLLPDVQRITRLGSIFRQLSIDELPQLINIIKGDMSFIGPRPLLVQYLEYYTSEQMRRHDVLPGITGWAQVNGRNTIDWESKFKLDIWYVENVSFLVDVKILIATIKNVLMKKDINNSSAETMPIFTGSSNKETI